MNHFLKIQSVVRTHCVCEVACIVFMVFVQLCITVSTYVHVCVAVCTYINVCGQAYM